MIAAMCLCASDLAAFMFQPRLTALPDNPCELLTQQEMATITEVEITSVQRVPSIGELAEAQGQHRQPDAGIVCVYSTSSPMQSIAVVVPRREQRTAEAYWSDRQEYFQTFGRSARAITDVGRDAWIGGGATLHVLLPNNEPFTISIQHPQFSTSAALLSMIGEAIAARF